MKKLVDFFGWGENDPLADSMADELAAKLSECVEQRDAMVELVNELDRQLEIIFRDGSADMKIHAFRGMRRITEARARWHSLFPSSLSGSGSSRPSAPSFAGGTAAGAEAAGGGK